MLTARLILERISKDGRLLQRRERPARSFIQNFLGLLYVAHANIAYGSPYSMQDITNTARDVDSSDYGYRNPKNTLKMCSLPGGCGECVNGGANTLSTPGQMLEGEQIGIVAGTGNTAVAPLDYAMETPIAHGSGAGELEYGGTELVGIVFSDPDGEFTIRRYFTNNSGGGITVEEVGIYAVGTKYLDGSAPYTSVPYTFCIARDLTGGITPADTELLRVTYVVQITV